MPNYKYSIYVIELSKKVYSENISTKAEALKMEEQLAIELRRKRYAVWFN